MQEGATTQRARMTRRRIARNRRLRRAHEGAGPFVAGGCRGRQHLGDAAVGRRDWRRARGWCHPPNSRLPRRQAAVGEIGGGPDGGATFSGAFAHPGAPPVGCSWQCLAAGMALAASRLRHSLHCALIDLDGGRGGVVVWSSLRGGEGLSSSAPLSLSRPVTSTVDYVAWTLFGPSFRQLTVAISTPRARASFFHRLVHAPAASLPQAFLRRLLHVLLKRNRAE